MKKIMLYTTILLVFSFAHVFGQDNNRNSELLAWFPNGDYESVQFTDIKAIEAEESPGYKQLISIVGTIIKEKWKDLPLPQSFISIYEGGTLASLSGYKRLSEEELEERNKPENGIGSEENLSPITIAFKTENGKRVFHKLHHETTYLWVFTFGDVTGLIEKEKRKGILSPQKKYRKQQIYSFNPKSGGKFYASPTHTNLLLVSKDRKHLEAMIRAGLGEEESILDSPVWSESIENVNRLGNSWMISDISIRTRIQLEEEKKLGAPEERIDYLEKRLSSKGKIKQTYWEFAKETVQRQVIFFDNEEFAERAHEETVANFQKQRKRANSVEGKRGEYARAVFGNMRCDLDGKTIIISRFMGEEYLKIGKADSLRRKRLAEKEAKKKNRNNSK